MTEHKSENGKRGTYKRRRLEDFIEDTIPPITHKDTEIFFNRVTSETLGLLRPEYGPVVLDVASGMGMDSCMLAERGFHVISMEPMKDMIGYVRFHHEKNGRRSMYLRGYAEEIPLAESSVDQVLCKGSIDHFLDPRAGLAEMRRVLKPGGRFIVAAANYDSISCYFSKVVTKVSRYYYGPPPPDAPRPTHEIPSDHVTRFNSRILRRMVEEYFEVRRAIGIGFLWGAPFTNYIWDRLPEKITESFLDRLYDASRHVPSLADMTLLDCVKPVG